MKPSRLPANHAIPAPSATSEIARLSTWMRLRSVAITSSTNAMTTAAPPAMKNAVMLLTMFASVSCAAISTDQHLPLPGVGTSATTGASMPPMLSSMSSRSSLDLSAIMQTPMAISVPTKIACTGV